MLRIEQDAHHRQRFQVLADPPGVGRILRHPRVHAPVISPSLRQARAVLRQHIIGKQVGLGTAIQSAVTGLERRRAQDGGSGDRDQPGVSGAVRQRRRGPIRRVTDRGVLRPTRKRHLERAVVIAPLVAEHDLLHEIDIPGIVDGAGRRPHQVTRAFALDQ